MPVVGEEGQARERVQRDKVTNCACGGVCVWFEKRARRGAERVEKHKEAQGNKRSPTTDTDIYTDTN